MENFFKKVAKQISPRVKIEVDSSLTTEELDMRAKIVTFDIENMANLLWSWSTYGGKNGWNAIATEFPWHIMCFAYKWLGKKAEVVSVWDYKGYKPFLERHEDGTLTVNPQNEYDLMLEMRNILHEADIVVGWNSKRFDIKKVQSKMIALGIEPPSPFKQIDVMQEKKRLADSNSNKLEDTGIEWGLGRKLQHEGWPLWMGCAEGDQKSMRKMERYNIQDVNLTEKCYLYLRPWMQTHPNLNAYTLDVKACSACGKKGTLERRGFTPPTNTGFRRQRFVCQTNRGGCGKWCSGTPDRPDDKLEIVK